MISTGKGASNRGSASVFQTHILLIIAYHTSQRNANKFTKIDSDTRMLWDNV